MQVFSIYSIQVYFNSINVPLLGILYELEIILYLQYRCSVINLDTKK